MKLEKNVGTLDRLVRLVLAVVMFVAGALYLAPPLNYVAYVVGALLLVTGTTRMCMAYHAIGISTVEKAAKGPKKKK
jgi:uncharacterized membrane protein HdeD (DUF308 family)